MFNSLRRLAALGLLLAVAPAAAAQIAQGATTRLLAFSIDGAGGGIGSLDTAGYPVVGDLSSATVSAPEFNAHIGFLAGNDPQFTNVPILFGIEPAFGPLAGGTSLQLSGLNFDRFGTGGSMSVTIGGQPVDNLAVLSNSLITATAPSGSSGPGDVTVAGSLGATTKPGAYVYTPAITTTGVVPIGGQLDVRNYGDVGNEFWTFISLTSWSAPTKFGTLLIGPVVFQLFPPTPYPQSDGVSLVSFPVPNDPVLQGLAIHFQSLSMTSNSPVHGSLTNASVTTIP